MSKLLRALGTVVAVVLSVLTFVPNVAQAGLAAGVSPTFPATVTVGDTGLAASIVVRNLNDGGESTLTNTVCNFGDAIPPCTPTDPNLSLIEDSGINAILSCSLIGVATTCALPGADPGVFKTSATGTGSGSCLGTTFDILEKSDAYGTLRFTPQSGGPNGPNVTLAGSGSECTISFTFDVLKMPVDQDPADPGVQTVQIADNAQWSTNLNNDVRGTDDMTVSKATPAITTIASAGGGLGAITLTDTASVTGLVSPEPGATVSFRLYGPADPTCASTPVFESLNVAYPPAGGPVTSASYTPIQAGTHRWVATYNGDANNNSVAGTCGDPSETTDVSKADPTIVTTASTAVKLGAGQLSDIAVVNGRVSPLAGATIDFRLYGPADATCSAGPVFTSLGVAYPAAGGPVSSATYTPTTAGTHRWVATYSGDANNNSVTGTCGDTAETTEVAKATPALNTEASPNVALGGSLTDTATVTGRVTAATSTVDFRLYGPNDETCTTTPVFESLGVPLSPSDTSVNSAAFTPTLVGVYRWIATYNGDVNNDAVSGSCGDVAERAEVFRGIPTIVTAASADVVLGSGATLTDVAIVNGRIDPVAGATIDFRLYGPNDASCTGAPIFTSPDVPYSVAGGAVTSGAFTPTLAGTYRWVATYSGDANNSSVSGVCGDPAETSDVLPSPDPTAVLPETGPASLPRMIGFAFGFLLLGALLLNVGSQRRRPYHVR